MKYIYIFACIICSFFFVLTGCSNDFLEKSPTDSVSTEELFNSVVGAETALNGLHRSTYYYYGNHGRFGQKSIDLAIDLMGEDFLMTDQGYGWFVNWYKYLITTIANNADLEYVWAYYYDIIDNANPLIIYTDQAEDATLYESKVNSIKGQAYAYRAYSFYQLVQLFAKRYEPEGANSHLGIPLILDDSGDRLPRSTVAEVYKQILEDINQSIDLLSKTTTTWPNKSHITLNVAQGIKARVALTMGDWPTAAKMANAARQGYELTSNYMSGWNRSADSEWMWGAYLIDEQQTSYASFFSHIDPLFGGYATLGNQKIGSTEIINYMGDKDQRKLLFKTNGGKENVGYKFTGNGEWTNDYLFMKAGEMYLIEAEALARQREYTDAQNVIFELTSNRNPDAVKSTLTDNALIEHILMERRCDLWGDGLRWLDLKRLNIPLDRKNKGHNETFWGDASFIEPTDWRFTFLIPKQEMDSNPNMVQNDTK